MCFNIRIKTHMPLFTFCQRHQKDRAYVFYTPWMKPSAHGMVDDERDGLSVFRLCKSQHQCKQEIQRYRFQPEFKAYSSSACAGQLAKQLHKHILEGLVKCSAFGAILSSTELPT